MNKNGYHVMSNALHGPVRYIIYKQTVTMSNLVVDTDTLVLLRMFHSFSFYSFSYDSSTFPPKFVFASPPSKQARSTWNFIIVRRMVSTIAFQHFWKS